MVAMINKAKKLDYLEREIFATLTRIGSTAVPALIAFLRNGTEEMRVRAAHTLGRLGPMASTAAPVLEEALADPSLLSPARATPSMKVVA
jgi:hypothetical protein